MKPRLLFISPVFLFPTDAGGKIRTTNVLRGLKSGAFEVTLLSPATSAQEEHWGESLDGLADRFVPWRPAPSRKRWRRAFDLLGDLPVNVVADDSAEARQAIVRLLKTQPFDLVVFDFVHSAVLVPEDMSCRSVCFTHNVEAEIFARHAQTAKNPLMRRIWQAQKEKMCNFEKSALQTFDAVIAVSDRDARTFRDDYKLLRVETIPTGVDLDHFSWSRPQQVSLLDGPVAVFTGSMDWAANVDGVIDFLEHVWPKVLMQSPNAKFVIVGRNPPQVLQSLSQRQPGVTCTGYVDDVRPFVRSAQAFVIPLRVGGGTRIKAFEAMAMGCPVVSTTIGMEGLEVNDGEHYLCRDSHDEQARGVLELFNDHALSERLSLQARQLVENKFGHRKAADAFEQICLSVLGPAGVKTAHAATG